MCCFTCQCSTYTLLQIDNFIRITFVGRLLSGGWQFSHANERNTVIAKEDIKQMFSCCNVIWTLTSWFFIKLKFLRTLNFSQSFQEQVVTWSGCNYATCGVPRKVRRSPNLRGVQRSPEPFERSTDFRVPETQISIAQSTCGKWKLVLTRFYC